MDNTLKLKIFLKKSKLRQEVWDSLTKEKTATEIAKALDKHRSAISRVFLDMEKAGFIRCLNSRDSSFRFYVRR